MRWHRLFKIDAIGASTWRLRGSAASRQCGVTFPSGLQIFSDCICVKFPPLNKLHNSTYVLYIVEWCSIISVFFALISLDEYAIWAQRQILIKSGQLFRWEDTMETHFYILQRLSEPRVWHHDMNSSLYPGSWVVTASSAGTFLSGNEFVGLFNQAHSSCCMGSLYLWSKLYVFSSRWRY